MKIIFTKLALISCIGTLFAITEELPIGFTEEEWENRHLIYKMGTRQTDPPESPIRNISEFERMQGALIRYPFGISTSVIQEMAEDVTVYCLVSSGQQTSAYNSMNNAGVDMDHVEFVIGVTDSYWTRDYGPWWVVSGDDEVVVVDHTYNRPRPNDNQAPYKMAQHLDAGYYDSDIVHAGGNYMTDGYGVSASSTLPLEENPSMSEAEINALFLDYYGVHQYNLIEDPNNTYIDHIDCWGKYLSPTKVLVRSVQTSHPQYDAIEEVVDYFENITNAFNEPYEIFRVYTPQNQPYTNSLILNGKVLVPIMNSQWDDDAIAAYEEALPGYEVLGFTGSWESTDALHCRVKGIPDIQMLQIFHNPIDDQEFSLDGYEVVVNIVDLSQAGLIEGETIVYWENSLMDEYEAIPLESTGNIDEYVAIIPSQPIDTEVRYFIHSADLSDRIEQLPIAGYFSFDAIGGTPTQSGDVNMDGMLDILDIVTILNHILNVVPMEGYPLILADANDDGIVNVLDIVVLINIILGN